ncbi:hypothetical protein LX99_02863 [Mucilaginibacter oryzae]|uniref:Uncharacterized protein n=1 Tax=Mucilaginibacter oryzae TaxID=468058 RepID=A0A316H9M6_9SPHI|nr:hypothetical protein [Mucilaginibacter oryzae]PWK77053.1 hypothetical protein LX99_02863 [Mucilaginibacter oryzae]
MPTAPDNRNHFHFILTCFTPQDIEGVMQDIRLSMDGYNFLYSLDTFDIMENYMPYIKIELFSKSDRNFQAQKYICYDYFFGKLNSTNCILLNEYKIELIAAKNKLNKVLRDVKATIKNLDDLKKETDNFLSNPEKTEEFVKNNLEIILLLLILNDKSYSILQEFFLFIKTRLNIIDIPVKNKKDREQIDAIFESTNPTSASAQVFRDYVEQNRKQLIVEKPAERHIFLENTFRDIQAIERSIKINDRLEKELKNKYCLNYLSSAKKTSDIVKLIEQNVTSQNITQNKTLHRNIYQYFLFDRLKNEYAHNPQIALHILTDLKELLQQFSENASQNEHLTTAGKNNVIVIIKRLFDDNPNVLENHFNFSVYEKYEETFNRLTSGQTEGPLPLEELTQIINEVNKNKNLYQSKIYALESSVSQLRLEYEVIETFWKLEEFEPEYRPGRDVIKNPYQHLPNLLLISDSFNSALKDRLYMFLNLSAEATEKNQALLKQHVKKIMDELYFRNDNSIYYKTLRSLIFTYLNFVAQSKFRPSSKQVAGVNDKYSEERIILDLERQYEIVKLQYERIDFKHIEVQSKLHYVQGNQELLNEINYLLLWLYRRNDLEDQAMKISRGLNYAELEDPRIFQGIGLCHVAAAYKKIEKAPNEEEAIKYEIDMALQMMKSAQLKYQLLINGAVKTEASKLIIKNYIAVLNSVADLCVRKFEMQIAKPDESLIIMARECITEIKTLFNMIDLFYDLHPTYLATEIEVEYFEAQRLYGLGKMSSAHEKIIDATKRLFQLNNLPDTQIFVGSMFLKKAEQVNKLASLIYQKIPKK